MPDSGVKDVAALARVSASTVSNVLNRPERVSPSTVARVLAAIDELGFVRNDAARQLRVGRSDLLGLAVINISNPFFTEVANGVEEAARAAGYSVLLGNSASTAEGESGFLDLFERQRVDGVLIVPLGDVFDRLETLRRRGTPAVLIDRVDEREVFSSVSTDDVSGGRLVGEHLLSLGRRRLWFVGDPTGAKQVSDRFEGFRRAVEAAAEVEAGAGAGGTVANIRLVQPADLDASGGVAVGRMIAALPSDERPDGVFAVNDMLALGIIQGLTGTDVRVPDDLALVGYDDIVFAAAAAIPLTSVDKRSAELGRVAAELLLEQLTDPDAPRQAIVFEPRLIVRASTAGAAATPAAASTHPPR